MSETLRTFVAVEVPSAPFREILSELARIGRPVKVGAEPLHLTLKFLGETEQSALEDVKAAVAEICGQHAPIEAQLQTVDAFPRRERPSVIWAGLFPAEPLAALASNLESRLASLGFPPEERAFHPHVTLARVRGRPPHALAEVMDLYADETFGNMTIREVTFYHSELSRQGPQYSVLSTAVLSGQ